ncbi:beta-ketoacyl synthase N-terminal-like domain-containing protein, partial [Streptomyces sp. AB3(2024)]|uniref:beta-ketoacyl synthase N-terminal-like domain-containing protein n=1 Tax=Streptomyces sp. AB3(2024) TaxID=3317321 RepID=UPI0035A2C8C6
MPLPTYAFDTKRYWIERKTAGATAPAARLFRPVFRQEALTAAITGKPGERWIVFTDALGIAERWTARLREAGEHVVTVEAGTSFERSAPDAYRLRPEATEDFDRLVRELQAADGTSGAWNVLYLWAVDTEADVDRARVFALDALVHFARALGLHRGTEQTRLAVVTRGLARVSSGEPAPPTRALVLGPVKTLPLEYPALTASAIDIEGTAAEVDPLIAEIRASLPHSFVAYRDTTRYVEGVEGMTTSAAEGGPAALRPLGVYLITGGLGGIGRTIATWMARKYKARLVLIGRTPLPPREQWPTLESDPTTPAETRSRIVAVRELESYGAEVLVEACDVSDRTALADVVARAELRFGPVEGVVHAAGLAGGGLAQFRHVEAMRKVLTPKVDGTLALASVLRSRPLAFFAVFSSTGALLGSLGQVDYCAANAFLDAWAESPGAPERVVAIAWDAWRNVGMASHERLPAAVLEAHVGDEPTGISASDALAVFERALFGGQRRVIVSAENLPSRLARGTKRHQERPADAPVSGPRSRAEIESTLTEIWENLFGRSRIDRDANFFDLGGDSLLIVEAGQQVKKRLQVSLAVADLFKYPTIARLAERLVPTSSSPQDVKSPSTTIRNPAENSDIAVIGMAARFPGADNVDAFWNNLVDGVESLVPTDEPSESAVGGHGQYVAVAGSADGVDLFDPAFFGFTPREAELMDPQQRLLLMCSYQALENAGYAPRGHSGTTTAVYVGAAMSSYLLNNLIPQRGSSDIDPTVVGLGNDKDFAATHISYRLNLRGPSVSVSTACSTSLVAIAHACRSLISGDSDMALAGGAKVRAPERSGYWFQEGGIMSPDGRCRAFDADGQGTVFSSGAGIVVLKRLSDAVRDGDTIRAVIRGSAVNNDGADKVGFTAPSVTGQASVIHEAQQVAGVDAESIGYVEAHGTATSLGDPIEVAGLTDAFRKSTSKRGFCALGSVKTNVGHLDTAAGVAGFIKAVLCVERGLIPPSLHYRTPNPEIDFESSPFFVNAELRDWSGPAPRRAGVSSFGLGGTNAHVIVEQPPVVEAPDAVPSGTGRGWEVLVTSGKTPASLSGQRARLADHLAAGSDRRDESALPDVAFTLQTGREHLEHRAAVVARSGDEAARALAAGGGLVTGQARSDAPVSFLFVGGGSQFVGMGRELYEREGVFREVFEQCARVVQEELGEDL